MYLVLRKMRCYIFKKIYFVILRMKVENMTSVSQFMAALCHHDARLNEEGWVYEVYFPLD